MELGSFLLWFVMPQLLLYAATAVSTALLQADRRFVAAALNPICNNVIVIATMVAFASVHEADAGLALTTGEKLLLGGGTLLGTIGLTVVPVIATRRAGLGFRPRWSAPGVTGLGALARKGAWGAGDIGLNQVLVAATVVFAGRVPGGVIAYQTAFTFFLLPHAVLAHPIFTVRFPELAAYGAAGDNDGFAAEVASSMRTMAMLLAPAAALMAAMAAPLLALIRVGQLDAQGSELVAAVLASFMTGLLGYSCFFLLTRASYAIDDVRSPTTVFLGVTAASIVGMAVTSSLVDGDAAGDRARPGQRRGRVPGIGRPLPAAAAPRRPAHAHPGHARPRSRWRRRSVAGSPGWRSPSSGGTGGREAFAALLVGGTVGLAAYVAVLLALREPEVVALRGRIGPRG